MFKSTKALVLRQVKYKEADLILTVLTATDGKLTVKARGALRKGSRVGAAAQALCYSDMTLFFNRGKWTLNEAQTIEQFLPLRADLEKLALASYFAEALEAVADEDDPQPELLQLGLNCLYALSATDTDPLLVKAAFELRLMCLSGYEPQLDVCPVCGKAPEDALFSVGGGCLHCRSCPPGTPGISLPLGREALEAMRYVASAPPRRILAFTLPPAGAKQLGEVCEAYLLAQLERGFGALDYWKRLHYQRTTHTES